MKHKLFLLAVLIPALSFAQEKQEVIINGTLKNEGDKYAKVFLFFTDNGEKRLDSSSIVDGKYTIKTSISAPLLANVLAIEDRSKIKGHIMVTNTNRAQVYISAGTITLSSGANFSDMTVKGSKLHDIYAKLNEEAKAYDEDINAAMLKYNAYAKEGNDKGKKEAWEERNQIRKKMLQEVYGAFVKKHPESPLALYALLNYASGGEAYPNEAEVIFKTLPVSLQESPEGHQFITRLQSKRSLAIGAIAPDFTQNDTLGKPVTLSSFRGKYVLLDFWASWCGPCRKENPNVVAAYNAFKDKGFTILSVSLDQADAKDKWLKAIHDDKLTWTHVSDLKYWGNEVALKYGVGAVPTNFLLDKDGRIIATNLRGEALAKKLAELLN